MGTRRWPRALPFQEGVRAVIAAVCCNAQVLTMIERLLRPAVRKGSEGVKKSSAPKGHKRVAQRGLWPQPKQDLNTEVTEASQREQRRKPGRKRPALGLLCDLRESSANSVLNSCS